MATHEEKLDEKMLESEDQGDLVVITDEDGNESYYLEEMVIPMDGKNFALLTAVQEEEAADEADEVIIARVEFDEKGEPVYLDPTDEEFSAVRKAYETMMYEMDVE